jgi:hypothetical protein
MSSRCKTCEAHKKAYQLLERDARVGTKALDATLEPFMEHLRMLEAESYKQAMEAYLRSSDRKGGPERDFLSSYAKHLEKALQEAGCDLALAKQELRCWMSRGGQDYSGLRIGLSLLESDLELGGDKVKEAALSA